jgi:sorbitol-specific phosphotransferase system component IIBC
MVHEEIMGSIYRMVDQFIAFVPTLIAIILLIIIGKLLGTYLGKIGAKILVARKINYGT